MKRGEVYLADLSPRSGSEQRGIRPAIVLTHDGFNQNPNWHSIIVIPVSTSGTQASRGLTVVRLPQGAGGLDRESIALCHQITTLDRSKLTRRLGELPGELPGDLMVEVGNGVKAAVDLT